jgi:CBS domain containing-hemolysin-like protein
VYEESYDNVEGTLSSRDMLIAIAKGEINQEDTINDFIRPVHFVPGSKTVGELFNDMRIEKYQMAVVLNEYGGTSGIVTIDQLVEHIVGEIGEELVAAKKGYEVVGASMYKIQGNTKIEDVNKELKLGIPEGDYQTVGGFALHLFGRLPKEGEKITAGELRLLIAEVKENKITRLFITKEKKLEPQGKAK